MYGTVSGLSRYVEGFERYQSMNREDSHQIQVICNAVMRAVTELPQETPVYVLLVGKKWISILSPDVRFLNHQISTQNIDK